MRICYYARNQTLASDIQAHTQRMQPHSGLPILIRTESTITQLRWQDGRTLSIDYTNCLRYALHSFRQNEKKTATKKRKKWGENEKQTREENRE